MLRRKETEHNLRQHWRQNEPGGQQSSTDNPDPNPPGTYSQTEEWVNRTPIQGLSPYTTSTQQSLPRDQSPSSDHSIKPNTQPLERAAELRLQKFPTLARIAAQDYTYFVDLCLEDAIWWLESRLVFGSYTTVPKDAFKRLFDDPDEGLPGYGFLTEERNKDITERGFFDILANYSEHACGRPPPPAAFLRYNDPNSQYPEVSASQEQKEKKKKKTVFSWGTRTDENRKIEVREKCDRIGGLLMNAGYRPNPADSARLQELQRGDYPEPVQYHADVQAFLELILCLIFATCPRILDVEDILGLTFANNDGGYRTLRYENGHLVILSFESQSDRIFRTIIPDPLSRLILIYLADVRPFIALLNTDKESEQQHWHQEYLFPARAGGCWSKERMDELLQTKTRQKMGLNAGIGIEDFRAVYFNLKDELGEGWLYEKIHRVEENGLMITKGEMGWSKEPPEFEGENHPGGERYLIKHFESSRVSPIKRPVEGRSIEV
ncbi:hypothetical protein TWF281_002925 [Arthrobotrys megalospora]